MYHQRPLAEQFRPKTLEDVVGQPHLVGSDGWIRRVLASKKPRSILLVGPPGCGKTTLAQLYAQQFDAQFLPLNPVLHGISDLKKAIDAMEKRPLFQKYLVVFVDEIHRFNKAQQDVFLPFVEQGKIVLIGATTENPSFCLNNALLSRLSILHLNPLTEQDLLVLLHRYEEQKGTKNLTDEAKETLAMWSLGDARHLFNMLESLEIAPKEVVIEKTDLAKYVQQRAPLYDKSSEAHYNLISALHKAVRGSDPDAALYWLARMLHGGEDRQFLARRIIRMAAEDIGLADPNALSVAIHAWQAFDQLGIPEGDLMLAQAVVYMALAPKSNAIYTALQDAMEAAKTSAHLPPPKTILNAPTQYMKEQGYGKGYLYDHDTKNGFSGQNYFPEDLKHLSFYVPKERGFEREMKKRLEYFENQRRLLNA